MYRNMAATAVCTGGSLSNSTVGFLRTGKRRRIQVVTRHINNRGLKCLPAGTFRASLALDASGLITSKKLQIVKKDVGEESPLGALPVILKDMAETSIKIFKPNNVQDSEKNMASEVQLSIEKGLLNCRFFTLAAVAGSLIGSLLCFFEGCCLILESFFEYFRIISNHLDGGETMRLLIEAVDMYFLGTGMLNFGFGMYIMFVGTSRINGYRNIKEVNAGTTIAVPLQQMIPGSSMERHWLPQAKSRLGHAVMMILHAGTVEKFKNVTMTTGLDMACFAGAIFISSASLFLLSKLFYKPTKTGQEEQEEEEETRGRENSRNEMTS